MWSLTSASGEEEFDKRVSDLLNEASHETRRWISPAEVHLAQALQMAQRVDGDGHVHARVDQGEFFLLVRGEVQYASFILAQIEG